MGPVWTLSDRVQCCPALWASCCAAQFDSATPQAVLCTQERKETHPTGRSTTLDRPPTPISQVDLNINLVERKTGGLGAGGGLSSQVGKLNACFVAALRSSTANCLGICCLALRCLALLDKGRPREGGPRQMPSLRLCGWSWEIFPFSSLLPPALLHLTMANNPSPSKWTLVPEQCPCAQRLILLSYHR